MACYCTLRYSHFFFTRKTLLLLLLRESACVFFCVKRSSKDPLEVGRQRTCCACCRMYSLTGEWQLPEGLLFSNSALWKVLPWLLSSFFWKGGSQTAFFTPISFIASCRALRSWALALLAAHWAYKSSVGFIEHIGTTPVLFRGHLTVKMYVIHNCVAKKEIPCASIHIFFPSVTQVQDSY